MRNQITFFLNGTKQVLGPEQAAQAQLMLADYLRQERRLTGTKIVCAEGDCGACTVLRGVVRPDTQSLEYLPINSCITRVAQMDGSSLITVEGVTPTEGLSPVQKMMVECHGSQCGFCTPGFVMALSGLVEKKLRAGALAKGQKLDQQEVKNSLTGNLCRCTGYQPIIDAALAIPLGQCQPLTKKQGSSEQLKDLKAVIRTPLELRSEYFSYFSPTTVSAAVSVLKRHVGVRLVSGGTDLGVLQNKRKLMLSQLMSLQHIEELYALKQMAGSRVLVGANITLSDLREFLKKRVPEFARFLDLFASPQIKNVATLAGNVGNASPIAETPPFLLVSNTVVQVAGAKGRRKIPLERFFLGYRKTALKKGEFIVSFEFDLPGVAEVLSLKKVSQRKDLDISALNAAFRAEFAGQKIKMLRIALGGVAAIPLRLKKTEKLLLGKSLSKELLDQAIDCLQAEINPLNDLRGSSAFRRILAENLLRGFLLPHLKRCHEAHP